MASVWMAATLRVFLDCSSTECHEDYLREEVKLADYVRDRADADVHVLVTEADTAGGGEEYTFSFIGVGAFQSTSRLLTVIVEANESDDRVRRQLASALTLGLLGYLAPQSLPAGLQVNADLQTVAAPTVEREDPWRRWIFNVSGFMFVEAEEARSFRNWGLSGGSDRITPEFKFTLGVDFNESRNRFALDDDEGGGELSVIRKNRSLEWLAVKSLTDHWSAGLRGEARSSTFDNLELEIEAAPAIEWNFFPYSMYTRRQFRVLYAIGGSRRSYNEETLFGKLQESRGRQALSTTYEQREPWGTLEGRFEASNYFPGFSAHRFEVEAEADVRVTRGLSVTLEASATRIRDQLSLPKRDASAEEVLLRLRQLSSGFETRFEVGIEYRFGSRFAAIVNPRFGQ